jgi:hypothetical protein
MVNVSKVFLAFVCGGQIKDVKSILLIQMNKVHKKYFLYILLVSANRTDTLYTAKHAIF